MNAIFSPHNGALSCGENKIRLTEQCRLCMVFFVQHEGQLVTREALTEACWGTRGVIVSDATVRQTVFRLRRNFTEVGLEGNTLETVGKAGYMLAAGVITLMSDSGAGEALTDIVEDELVSPEVIEATPQRSFFRLNPLSLRKLFQYGLIIFVAGAAGYFARVNMLVNNVDYRAVQTLDGRHYFSSTVSDLSDSTSVVNKVHFWLEKEQVSQLQSQYVYINGQLNAFTVTMICDKPVDDSAAVCRTFTLLGDNHS